RVVGDSRIGSAFFRETGEIVLYAPSFKLIDQFGNNSQRSNDVRFSAYIQYDPARQTASNGVKSAYLVNKYRGGNSSYPGLTPIKLFRTGEMYLIRAEAQLEANPGAAGLNAAAQDLHALRNARIFDYAAGNISDRNEMIEAIYTERFKE